MKIKAWLVRMGLSVSVMLTGAAAAQPLVPSEVLNGMFRPTNAGYAVARDTAKGWTYYFNQFPPSRTERFDNMQGVKNGGFGRTSDVGVIDPAWSVDVGTLHAQASAEPEGWYPLINDDGVVLTVVTNCCYSYFLPYIYRYWQDDAGIVRNSQVRPDEYAKYLKTNKAFGVQPLYMRDGRHVRVVTTLSEGRTSFALGSYDAAGNEEWTANLEQPGLGWMTVDAAGSVYLIEKHVLEDNWVESVSRIDRNGIKKSQWVSLPEQGRGVMNLRVVDNSLVVVRRVNIVGEQPRHVIYKYRLEDAALIYQRAIIDSSGELEYASIKSSSDIAIDGTLSIVEADGNVKVIDTATADGAINSIVVNAGKAPLVHAVIQQGDYWVIGGQFEYWFEGRQYRNLLWVDMKTGTLDDRAPLQWERLNETQADYGEINSLALDSHGKLIVGGRFTLNGQSNLVRLTAQGDSDHGWRLSEEVGVINHVAVTAADDLLINSLEYPYVARLNVSGQRDTAWGRPVHEGLIYLSPAQAQRVLDLGVQGVLICGKWDDPFGLMGIEWGLLDVNGNRVEFVPELSTYQHTSCDHSMQLDEQTGTLFILESGYYTAEPDAPMIQSDSTWQGRRVVRMNKPVLGFDGQYVYYLDAKMEIRRMNSQTLTRDDDWLLKSNVRRIVGALGGTLEGVNAQMVGWGNIGHYSYLEYATAPSQAVFFSNTTVVESLKVVEYFIPQLNHFFMTGRANEQALLDALPHQFRRTGMQFNAPAGNDTTDGGNQHSICRFYAPPSLGGSNTHFYGRSGDCNWLHGFTGWLYEGLDFSAELPISSGDGMAVRCPSTAPNAIHRLYNKRAAQNDSNHRYVVSDTRRLEMTRLGWEDEGISFCVNGVVDSKPIGAL